MSSLLISLLSIPWWLKTSGPVGGSTLAQGIPPKAFAHCCCRGVVVFVVAIDVVVVVFVIVVDVGDDEVS